MWLCVVRCWLADWVVPRTYLAFSQIFCHQYTSILCQISLEKESHPAWKNSKAGWDCLLFCVRIDPCQYLKTNYYRRFWNNIKFALSKWLLSDYNTVSLFHFYFKSLSKKMIMYSIHIDRIVCFWGLHSHKGHRAQRANEGDVGCDLGWISPEPHQHAAKTNSRWWFASCLRSLWPASRQQPRDPQRSEGGAEESSGPPTGYKTRGRRKPSDSKHTWSKEAEGEEHKERRLESKRAKLLPPTGKQTNIETKRSREEKKTNQQPFDCSVPF